MDRKKKLETSLEGLFSSGKKRSQSEEKKAPEEAKTSQQPALKAAKKTSQPAKKPVEVKPSQPENPGIEKKAIAPEAENAPKAAPAALNQTPIVQPSENNMKNPEKSVPVEKKPETNAGAIKAEAAPSKEEPKTPVSEPGADISLPDVSKAIQLVNPAAIQTVAEEEGEIQVLVFGIAGVYYGVEVSYVQTIIKPQMVYLVPGTVKFIRGLINLRGEVVPVVDLRTRFGLQRIDVGQETRFVVVELDGVKASMVVDMVQGVITIPNRLIEQPSGVVMNSDTTYLKSVARLENQLVLNLDLKQTLLRSE